MRLLPVSFEPTLSPHIVGPSIRILGSARRCLLEGAPGLLGETVLVRALLFLGSSFYTAIFLVAAQSFPNKDDFQGQASSRKCRLWL